MVVPRPSPEAVCVNPAAIRGVPRSVISSGFLRLRCTFCWETSRRRQRHGHIARNFESCRLDVKSLPHPWPSPPVCAASRSGWRSPLS